MNWKRTPNLSHFNHFASLPPLKINFQACVAMKRKASLWFMSVRPSVSLSISLSCSPHTSARARKREICPKFYTEDFNENFNKNEYLFEIGQKNRALHKKTLHTFFVVVADIKSP